MASRLDPSAAQQDDTPESPLDHDAMRLLSRSPHPYHRQKSELLEPSGRLAYSASSSAKQPTASSSQFQSPTSFPALSRDHTPSDSGTDADDEHFLKGLPAPRTKLHKGIRGRNELLSEHSTPLPSPAIDDGKRIVFAPHNGKKAQNTDRDKPVASKKSKLYKELLRRATECLLLGTLGALVLTNRQARPILQKWRIELYSTLGCAGTLMLMYPLRLVVWTRQHRGPFKSLPLRIPAVIDPAPLLYPPAITLFVSALISVDNEDVLPLNMVLAICSLPATLLPSMASGELCNPVHWLLSCVPIFLSDTRGVLSKSPAGDIPQTAVMLYPLHQYLSVTLHSLTTTSLLTAELQLLSTALLNVLCLSKSPQAAILKAMLWVGGLDILLLCSEVVRWGISLARVPKWRFQRLASPSKKTTSLFSRIMPWKRVRHDLFHAPTDSSSCSSCEAHDEQDDSDDTSLVANGLTRAQTLIFDSADSTAVEGNRSHNVNGSKLKGQATTNDTKATASPSRRRHTLPVIGHLRKISQGHTPSGRRKRSASTSVRQFFSLTQEEATARKWIYALYVYICILGIIFLPGRLLNVPNFFQEGILGKIFSMFPLRISSVTDSVQEEALRNHEPVGWALGYLLGDIPWFRWQVVSHNLERWVCLPTRPEGNDALLEGAGWVQYLRHNVVGDANTRLLLCAYCVVVIGVGLIVVFRLSPFYEVDTRRKVFHFMMVAMFAPSIYVDPTFVALALAIVLALFLLLDLLRASQLPPLSKPLAYFLAPYVDGRDLRGPVVISHIFLLIGCAIPLWLTLGSLPRSGTGFSEGWEVPTREVSMISGVICVGLGDAAASLIGRRWGHRKWLWGGGKSLEGSLAFAVAVLLGLIAAHVWLRVGDWSPTTEFEAWPTVLAKAGGCASIASLTEAVLTGGNDNVIVPVILWTCVKSIGV